MLDSIVRSAHPCGCIVGSEPVCLVECYFRTAKGKWREYFAREVNSRKQGVLHCRKGVANLLKCGCWVWFTQ